MNIKPVRPSFDTPTRHHQWSAELGSRAKQTYRCNVFLPGGSGNVQSAILWVLRCVYCEYFFICEPDKVNICGRVSLQQLFGTAETCTAVCFSQFLSTTFLTHFKPRSRWIILTPDDCDIPVSRDIWRVERWLCGWLSWLSASSSTVAILSQCAHTLVCHYRAVDWCFPFPATFSVTGRFLIRKFRQQSAWTIPFQQIHVWVINALSSSQNGMINPHLNTT